MLLHHWIVALTLITVVTSTFLAIIALIPIIIVLLRIHLIAATIIIVAHRHEHRLSSALSTSELPTLRRKYRLVVVILLHHEGRILTLSILRLSSLFLLLLQLLLAILLHSHRHLSKGQLARVFCLRLLIFCHRWFCGCSRHGHGWCAWLGWKRHEEVGVGYGGAWVLGGLGLGVCLLLGFLWLSILIVCLWPVWRHFVNCCISLILCGCLFRLYFIPIIAGILLLSCHRLL